MTSQCFDRSTEFVRDVKFVGIKQKDDSVHSFGKPLQYTSEFITSVDSLFLPRQDARRVNNGDPFKHRRVYCRALEIVQVKDKIKIN